MAFTDGAASPNPGPAGSGISLWKDAKEVWTCSIPLGRSSNNIAELFALGAALQKAKEMALLGVLNTTSSYVILTDSRYALLSIGAYQIVKDNLDIVSAIRRLLLEVSKMCKVRIIWIPAHVGIDGNTSADDLASQGALLSALSSLSPSIEEACRTSDFLSLWSGAEPSVCHRVRLPVCPQDGRRYAT